MTDFSDSGFLLFNQVRRGVRTVSDASSGNFAGRSFRPLGYVLLCALILSAAKALF